MAKIHKLRTLRSFTSSASEVVPGMKKLVGGSKSSTASNSAEISMRSKGKPKKKESKWGGGGSGADIENNHHPGVSPEQKYRQCQQKCQFRTEVEERKSCQQKCKEEYSRERGQHEGEENLLGKKKEEEKQEKNPYFFKEQRFESRFRTQEGHFRVLERFSVKSEFLQGIDNYRLAILEANPSTFMIPHHWDAEAVFVVTNGEGTINFVHQQQRESFNLQHGDAIKVPAGSTVYLINRGNNENLRILMLVHPINTPGNFEEFYGAGGQDPKFYSKVFSSELLEAALNTPRDKFDRVFAQQQKGIIIKVSQEQIIALSQDREAGSSSQGEGGESRGPFNLLQQQPLFSNEFGQFLEASPDTHDQLRHLDFSVAFMSINQGTMVEPYYNTRSTNLVVVVGGQGHFEMACPHLGSQSQVSKGKKEKEHEKRSAQYQKVSSRLSVGDVFIIPAGHPISIVSSRYENLQLVGFGINARNNHKHFLAGGDNIWNQVQSEAKELSSGSQATEVDEVFRSQEKSYFVPGPKQSQEKEEGKGHSVASILDFVDFI